ncbi:zinc transporter ZIP11-like [Pecten maximus]|uniref:zinc transporter ZIP11-like n=1 Tax=Pecten maximus TaxID=6579 RepID=UPI00145870B9|nr:zinc transporter ZIP11-like [Pecten maximus]
MIAGYSATVQTILGTLFTWGLTAAGAGLVFVFQSNQRKVLDASLGFAAGVMTAASYWSLLAPAIEMAERSGLYGEQGQWAFLPVSIGFILGAIFVYGADVLMPYIGANSSNLIVTLEATSSKVEKEDNVHIDFNQTNYTSREPFSLTTNPAQRRKQPSIGPESHRDDIDIEEHNLGGATSVGIQWKRILLLIIAITIHNIPEGLAVGVGFGAVGKTPSATFENARNLAVGIGIQNFPEGLAVSLPLRGSGMSVWKSFWYGQLSGMVEPIAGLFGVVAVSIAEPLLPYSLAFAAGAMIYVVVDDIIPEAQTCGNGRLSTWGTIVGFVVMMSLDVGLG